MMHDFDRLEHSIGTHRNFESEKFDEKRSEEQVIYRCACCSRCRVQSVDIARNIDSARRKTRHTATNPALPPCRRCIIGFALGFTFVQFSCIVNLTKQFQSHQIQYVYRFEEVAKAATCKAA